MLVALTIQYSSNLCLLSSKAPFHGNIQMELVDYKIMMKFLIDKLTIFWDMQESPGFYPLIKYY